MAEQLKTDTSATFSSYEQQVEDLAKDDELYADQMRKGNFAPSLNKYGDQGWELVSASRVGGGRALTEYVFKRPKE